MLSTRVDDLTTFEITSSVNWTTFTQSTANSSIITYSSATGMYSSLDSTKTYRIDYAISLNSSNSSAPTPTSWIARIYSGNITTGTSLKEGQIGVQLDYAMPSITLCYIGSGLNDITPSLQLVSGTYSNQALDCQLSFTIQEIR